MIHVPQAFHELALRAAVFVDHGGNGIREHGVARQPRFFPQTALLVEDEAIQHRAGQHILRREIRPVSLADGIIRQFGRRLHGGQNVAVSPKPGERFTRLSQGRGIARPELH